jgi:hypothetical protein
MKMNLKYLIKKTKKLKERIKISEIKTSLELIQNI